MEATADFPILGKDDDDFINRIWTWLANGYCQSPRSRFRIYLLVLALALAAVWLPLGAFIVLKPANYISEWTVILPGSGAGHAVSLESIGQASATAASPFNNQVIDPKVNYREIIKSDHVVTHAAESLNLPPEAFGKPKIKLIDQAGLLNVSLTANTSADAHERAAALYEGFQAELNRLRQDEQILREQAVNDMLESFSDKLKAAQDKILAYQKDAEIVSLDHFTDLTRSLEKTRAKISGVQADRAHVNGELEALESALGVRSEHAPALIALSNDALFQELSDAWAKAHTAYTINSARWGVRHEKVVSARSEMERTRTEMLARIQTFTRSLKLRPDQVERLANDADLFRELVNLQRRKAGLSSEYAELKALSSNLKNLLNRSASDASNLEDLKRKHQVAMAVFSTALAKVDLGKSDQFSSYPMAQLLAQSSMPNKPDQMASTLAVICGVAASVFIVIGLVAAWFRKPFVHRIAKKH